MNFWKAFHIGWVLSVSGLFGAFLSLTIGVASDRLRRKPFLIVYEIIIFLCSIIAFFNAQALVLTLIIVIAGFGRGGSGAAGPFSPAEQAWLAEQVMSSKRGRVYSLNAAYGFFGIGIGAFLAMIPDFLNRFFFRKSPFCDPGCRCLPDFIYCGGFSKSGEFMADKHSQRKI